MRFWQHSTIQTKCVPLLNIDEYSSLLSSFCFCLFFWDRISVWSPDWPRSPNFLPPLHTSRMYSYAPFSQFLNHSPWSDLSIVRKSLVLQWQTLLSPGCHTRVDGLKVYYDIRALVFQKKIRKKNKVLIEQDKSVKHTPSSIPSSLCFLIHDMNSLHHAPLSISPYNELNCLDGLPCFFFSQKTKIQTGRGQWENRKENHHFPTGCVV